MLERGNFWVVTFLGIILLERTTRGQGSKDCNIKMFEKVGDGLGSIGGTVAEYHSIAYTSDGKLWFGSLKG